jgi:hypothetical protein
MRRTRWAVITGVVCISVGLLTFNASATFTAQVSPTHATDTGDMEFTLGAAGASHRIATASTNIVPGDYISRTIQIDVANEGGTMTGATITTSGSGNPSLVSTAHASGGLGLLLTACSQAWTENGGAPPGSTYTCGGSTSDIIGTYNATLSSATFANFVQTAQSLSNFSVADASTNYLLAVLKFPTNGPDSMESQSTTLTFQFDGVQRAGTNK